MFPSPNALRFSSARSNYFATELTSDNINANTGSATDPSEGKEKEGIADKVKHTLHIGGSK